MLFKLGPFFEVPVIAVTWTPLSPNTRVSPTATAHQPQTSPIPRFIKKKVYSSLQKQAAPNPPRTIRSPSTSDHGGGNPCCWRGNECSTFHVLAVRVTIFPRHMDERQNTRETQRKVKRLSRLTRTCPLDEQTTPESLPTEDLSRLLGRVLYLVRRCAEPKSWAPVSVRVEFG